MSIWRNYFLNYSLSWSRTEPSHFFVSFLPMNKNASYTGKSFLRKFQRWHMAQVHFWFVSLSKLMDSLTKTVNFELTSYFYQFETIFETKIFRSHVKYFESKKPLDLVIEINFHLLTDYKLLFFQILLYQIYVVNFFCFGRKRNFDSPF